MDLSEIPFELYYILIALVSIATSFIVTKGRVEDLQEHIEEKRKMLLLKDEEFMYLQMKYEETLRIKDEEITQLHLSNEEEIKKNVALKDAERNELLRLKEEEGQARKEEEIRQLHLVKDEELKRLKSSNEEGKKDILLWTYDQVRKYQMEMEDLKKILHLNEVEEKRKLQLKDEEIKRLQSSKDEEMTQLQSTLNEEREKVETLALLFLPEKAEDMLKITSRAEWGSESEVVRQRRGMVAEYVIVDGHGYTQSTEDCRRKLLDLETHQIKRFGDLICNFWISDSGNVFEGLGWDYFNYAYNGGLGRRAIKIGFIKKNRDSTPSKVAVRMFGELLKALIYR